MNKTLNIQCKICGETHINLCITVREMQLGTRESFEYFQCKNCECLQIKKTPENLDKYYPSDYYSFNLYPLFKKSFISRKISKYRTRYNLFGKSLIGKILALIHPNELLRTIGESKININSSVLDVGCGRGHTLYAMSTSGMKNLLGVDPYLESDIQYPNGLNILKKSITDLNEKFDLIMLHHVLEHIEDQKKILENIKDRLKPNGICLIRIPICSSYAWEKYGSNWVQIDAPRHLFIHSLKSIALLAKDTGFKVIKNKFDSEAFQFIGSEQYLKNISLNDKKSYYVNKENSIFSNKDLDNYKKEAIHLNKNSNGDQIAIFLQKN